MNNGVFKKSWESNHGMETRLQIVLLKANVSEVLQELHNGLSVWPSRCQSNINEDAFIG